MRYWSHGLKGFIKITVFLFLGLALAYISGMPESKNVIKLINDKEEIELLLENYFIQRGIALVEGDPTYIEEQFDTSSIYGKWAYEHEVKRINYIKSWSKARGAKFTKCLPKMKIFNIRTGSDSARIYMNVITKFNYIYNDDPPGVVNEFCIGTWHSMRLVKKQGIWQITVDWYSDPLEDSAVAGTFFSENLAENDKETYAFVGSRYNRAKAVEYADRYCGAVWDRDDGYKYNPKYTNYASLGGDCANFASQVLGDKNAGGLKMGGSWLYKNGKGSAAWVNAGSFTSHLLYSGKGRLVAKGKYDSVLGASKQLQPGDIVAYEKKGDIVHVSIVTAKDSKGTLLVNSHTNDRYHVPWDLGWGANDVRFWLVKING